jgi:hypothetical protein
MVERLRDSAQSVLRLAGVAVRLGQQREPMSST